MRLLVLLTALSLSACAGDGRQPLLVYSPHGKEMLQEYEAAFEAEHPTVDVQWIDLGSQEVYDRIAGERANPQASVWWGAPQTLFMQAADEGCSSRSRRRGPARCPPPPKTPRAGGTARS